MRLTCNEKCQQDLEVLEAETHSFPVVPTVVAVANAVVHTAVTESNAARQVDHTVMFDHTAIAENVSMVVDCSAHLHDQGNCFLLQCC